jgi:hypothetical protein
VPDGHGGLLVGIVDSARVKLSYDPERKRVQVYFLYRDDARQYAADLVKWADELDAAPPPP